MRIRHLATCILMLDAPYRPYADGFSEKQHKYGPFAPIRDAIKRLKSAASRKP
jgi:thiosulfate dehydrogenase